MYTPAATRLPLPELAQPLALHGRAASSALEQWAQPRLPAHTLMARAGAACFALSAALAPHARRVWVACGPGHNGGDGLLAAAAWQRRLQPLGGEVWLNWLRPEGPLSADCSCAWAQAQASGLQVRASAPPPGWPDLALDALFGLGLARAVRGLADDWIAHLQALPVPVLCLDLPSGLCADSGQWWASAAPRASAQRHTLSLLTLKPGLFTQHGRSAAGTLWFHDLGLAELSPPASDPAAAPSAWLHAPSHPPARLLRRQPLATHKGSYGSVAVIGGQMAANEQGTHMLGAALLAARAALRGGAGRVYLAWLAGASAAPAPPLDPLQPELMLRPLAALLDAALLQALVTVCGCGGGQAVAGCLGTVLTHSRLLVLDADALNAVADAPALQAQLAQRWSQGHGTVLTPHPLEAARLLGSAVERVQADRLGAAQALAERFRCVVLLKGAGTVVAAPGLPARINPSGNALLASPGSGDALAGLIGAELAQTQPDSLDTLQRACADAAYWHGLSAERWPPGAPLPSASELLRL
ncbi:MAG: NAD(P)H-hydrate dehydratase [Pseudomonadota bacterium]|jgi:hydroxyethylthiazole kinase-like uncharacterized protein yjeF